MIPGPTDERSEIAFFDLETTVPNRPGQGFAILEFGAILVCSRKLEELHSYSTLVRPANLSLISPTSVRCNGITHDAVVLAPTFAEIADIVYEILNGRIWAGHNIQRFDCVRIREAFAEIGRQPPENKGIIDTLALLTHKFGRRAGDMKMASLATYFGLGKQTHRSLDDVRMNLEVLKYCATVLFLESSLPDAFPEKSWVSPNATTRSRKNGKSPLERPGTDVDAPSSSSKFENISLAGHEPERSHPIIYLLTSVGSNTTQTDPFDMGTLSNEMTTSSLQQDVTMEEKSLTESSEMPSLVTVRDGGSAYAGFLETEKVSISSIRASFVPLFRGAQRMVLLHEDVILQLCCPRLRVRFGLSTKFVDSAGRPRLSFVVDAPPNLCSILDTCDGSAQKLSVESGSTSDWRQVVSRKPGFVNYPIVRLHIPTAVNGDVAQYATEIYQRDSSGAMEKLVFSKFEAAELETWFISGTFLDAYFSLHPYDYQQSAGIRLVAKKLIIDKE
ncbi:protein NEN1 [Ricinus communis]|uniref:Exonuclease, putative n=1 Tax=Ricinus communis TaxID=3988 RepID=B9RLV8_RICCO|nr:protein NEN1 [Ricinus communis]EEF47833.1 exonuclease, putative [Ricinus communis]|eukprot:XP_002514727.1 protein NEN1 [Ricinus communis]